MMDRKYGRCDECGELSAEITTWLESHVVTIPLGDGEPDDIEIPAPEGLNYRPFQKEGIAWAAPQPMSLPAPKT
ncbi:hypothetical protein [Ferrimicrobium sp.]|uniref:hypothetical protein n=1 Tax=Ferrimicrobium sp. TaxID=2926050 RepID=UPI00261C5020|nr:hypothetical protein [Ferrimicrobium sp.]